VTGTAAQAETPDGGRARLAVSSGWAIAGDGVRLAYDVFGDGDPTIVLLPSTPIVHSRQWKGQIHFLSRFARVIAYDGRGNGRSDRPVVPEAYGSEPLTGDLEAVLDATGTTRAVLVGLCGDGVWPSIQFASADPDRVLGIVAFAPGVPRLSPPHPYRVEWSFDDELPTDEGWAKVNRHYWRRDYPGFVRFFFETITSEPHSTKAIEDAVGWALDGSVDAMIADGEATFTMDLAEIEATCRTVRCPMVLVHGTDDHCQPLTRSRRLAELTGAPLVVVEGADHMIPGRHPVLANLVIRDFVRSLEGGTA
jgi:pimeloyl-ACP methyl ester carboxylesterase